MRVYAVQKSSSMINLTLSDQLLRNQSLRDQSSGLIGTIDRNAIDSKNWSRSDWSERFQRRFDRKAIDLKDWFEELITCGE